MSILNRLCLVGTLLAWALIAGCAAQKTMTTDEMAAAEAEKAQEQALLKDEVIQLEKDRALWRSTQYCNLATVENLIKLGARVNAQLGDLKTTPLMEAVRSYDNRCVQDTVELLVSNGADLEIADAHGNRAVHWAGRLHCTRNHLTGLVALVAAGAQLDVLNSEGKTALELATEEACTEKMEVLGSPANYQNAGQKRKVTVSERALGRETPSLDTLLEEADPPGKAKLPTYTVPGGSQEKKGIIAQ